VTWLETLLEQDWAAAEEAFNAHLPFQSGDLRDARTALSRGARRGKGCPCCAQMVKIYRRSIYEGMAAWLIDMCRETTGDEWSRVNPGDTRSQYGGDYAKLIHWGLVEQKVNVDPKKKDSGIWRPTARGRSFARGKLKVPKYAFIYSSLLLRTGGPKVSIHNVKWKKFSYIELWSA